MSKPPIQLPWYKIWFDSEYYHRLYAHRDEKEAGRFIDELVRHLGPSGNAVMLDVGCGSGRHCKQIALKGFRVTGFDLAASSIREAKKSKSCNLHFFQHDMRLPFGTERYDYVFNFFTSFGYFKDVEENGKVIRNISRSLKCGGKVVIDYLNVACAEKNLVQSEIKEADGVEYKITRWMNDDFFFKKIVLNDPGLGKPFENIEQVAKFNLHDFNDFFSQNSLKLEEVYGDYSMGTYDREASPRLIMIAKKIRE